MTDTVYRERAHLVALLAAAYPSTWTTDPEGTDWHIVYVELPTGQASWHIAPADVDLFPHVAGGDKHASEVWDNHTTDEKYARIREMTARIASAADPDEEPVNAVPNQVARLRNFNDQLIAANERLRLENAEMLATIREMGE